MARRWPETIRRRKAGEALRLYARLLVEHERVRRLGRGPSPSAAVRCRPSAPSWRPLHEVALFQAAGEAVAPLRDFCSRFADAANVPERVPCGAYLAALRVAVDLAGDAIVQNGGEPPWGAGEPRAPTSADAFEAVCRRLRDRDATASELGSLAAILDAAALRPEPPKEQRVLFDAAEYSLFIGGVAIAVPEGRERDFLRTLVTASKLGQVTPIEEHGRVWKGAVDQLRVRIQKATGRPLLGQVVLSARRPVCGYRLNPKVEIRYASEAGMVPMDHDALETMAHRALGGGRKSRPREDE